MTPDEMQHATDAMANLPSLPSGISPGTAGLWAANVLMNATIERGWPVGEVADLLLTLTVVTAAKRHTDDELHALLQSKLDGIRADRAVKQ